MLLFLFCELSLNKWMSEWMCNFREARNLRRMPLLDPPLIPTQVHSVGHNAGRWHGTDSWGPPLCSWSPSYSLGRAGSGPCPLKPAAVYRGRAGYHRWALGEGVALSVSSCNKTAVIAGGTVPRQTCLSISLSPVYNSSLNQQTLESEIIWC